MKTEQRVEGIYAKGRHIARLESDVFAARQQSESYRLETLRWAEVLKEATARIESLRGLVRFNEDRSENEKSRADRLHDVVQKQQATLDWAESLLCNAWAPAGDIAEWGALIKQWRDQKHGVKSGERK